MTPILETPETPQNINHTLLDWYDDERQVVDVRPRDQQRFSVQRDRAIQYLHLGNRAESQFELVLTRLAFWLKENMAKVSEGWVTLRDGGILFLVVSRSSRFDDDLEDAAIDLDLELAKDGDLDLVSVNVLVIPPVSDDSKRAFLNDRVALRYNGL